VGLPPRGWGRPWWVCRGAGRRCHSGANQPRAAGAVKGAAMRPFEGPQGPVARSATNGRIAAFTERAQRAEPFTAPAARGYAHPGGGGPMETSAAKRRNRIGGLGAEPPGARRAAPHPAWEPPLGVDGHGGVEPGDITLDENAEHETHRPAAVRSRPGRAQRRTRRPPPATEEPLWAVGRRGACPTKGFFEAHASAATDPWTIKVISVAAAGGDAPTQLPLSVAAGLVPPKHKASPGSAPPGRAGERLMCGASRRSRWGAELHAPAEHKGSASITRRAAARLRGA